LASSQQQCTHPAHLKLENAGEPNENKPKDTCIDPDLIWFEIKTAGLN
jgi:hypothetical protein